jgi:hypothetical protein
MMERGPPATFIADQRLPRARGSRTRDSRRSEQLQFILSGKRHRPFYPFFLAATAVLNIPAPFQRGASLKAKASRFDFNIVVEPRHPPSSHFLRRLVRAAEKYITAKAASNTPPNIKIKVVTICSPISISKEKAVGV